MFIYMCHYQLTALCGCPNVLIHGTGFLEKKVESLFPQWHRHWFVLNDGCLYYFKNRTDDGPRCIIPLENTKISKGSTSTELLISSASGELLKSSKLLETGGMELGKHTRFILCADTESERDAWVKALKEECNRIKPLHEIFLRKKDYVSLIHLACCGCCNAFRCIIRTPRTHARTLLCKYRPLTHRYI
jgi:hypothetical protein